MNKFKNMKCPSCGSISFTTERRMNGKTICNYCNYTGTASEWLPNTKNVCAYCLEAYENSSFEALDEHIKQCKLHPLSKALEEIEELEGENRKLTSIQAGVEVMEKKIDRAAVVIEREKDKNTKLKAQLAAVKAWADYTRNSKLMLYDECSLLQRQQLTAILSHIPEPLAVIVSPEIKKCGGDNMETTYDLGTMTIAGSVDYTDKYIEDATVVVLPNPQEDSK